MLTLTHLTKIDVSEIKLMKEKRGVDRCYAIQFYYTIRPSNTPQCCQMWRRIKKETQWVVHDAIYKDKIKETEERKWQWESTTWLEILLMFGLSKDEALGMFKHFTIYGHDK